MEQPVTAIVIVAVLAWNHARPSALAVFEIGRNSNLIGCSVGKSLAWAPFKILATPADLPARR